MLVVLSGRLPSQDSDGDKSDDNLVVDVSNEVRVLPHPASFSFVALFAPS